MWRRWGCAAADTGGACAVGHTTAAVEAQLPAAFLQPTSISEDFSTHRLEVVMLLTLGSFPLGGLSFRSTAFLYKPWGVEVD